MKKPYPTNQLFLYLFFALLGLGAVTQVRAQLPTSFQLNELQSGFTNATSMSFAPDGRIFILDRFGEMLIYKPDLSTTVSAGTIPVFHEFEDGLLAMAFDPNFSENNYIYVYYSAISPVVNRISRFTMNGDVINLGSEINMLQWEVQRNDSYHAGGDMGFDSQGNLYISIGDNTNHGSYAALDEGNSDNSAENSSSNTNDYRGKILRITPQPNGTYTIPPGNLFPPSTPNTKPEIYVMGARNPYRMFIDTQNNDWIFWGEVGPDANYNDPQDPDGPNNELGPEGLDEINLTKEAGNFGWPYFSGVDNDAYQITYASPKYYNNAAAPKNISTWNTGITDLPAAQPALLEFFHKSYFAGPRYYYDASLTDQQRLPAEFDGVFFYYDFNTSKVWAAQLDGQGNVLNSEQLAPSVFPDSNSDGYIDMEIGPDGHLYILEYGVGCCNNGDGSGKLVRVDYTGVITNSPPVVEATADVTDGPLPLEVNFSSEGTTDPDGDTPLSYAWDFETDGTVDSTEENPTHTYLVEGIFNAQLKVDDGNGATGVKNITIYAGNSKADFTFNSPPDGGLVGWGDDISIDVTVTDAEDGSTTDGGIDCNDVDIVPSLGHLGHFHPGATTSGCPNNLTLEYEGHNIHGEMDLFYVLGSEYTDEGNLVSFGQIQLHPKRKEAEFFDAQNDVAVIPNSDPLEGGSEAIQVNNDSHIVFEGRNLQNISSVRYRVASSVAGGSIEFRVGSPTGALLATTAVPNTGAADVWENVETTFTDPGGKNDLYFVFKNAGSPQNSFNVNYVEFIGGGVSMDNTPPLVETAEVTTPGQVTVEFSEYVTQATAEQIANYTIDNGVTVSAAVLQPDNRRVVLSISPLSPGTTYNLTVDNVENNAGLAVVSGSYPLSTVNSVRINTGGLQTIAGGQIFSGDDFFSSGTTTEVSIPIANTNDDALYQSERFGEFSYEIPVPASGEYDFRLHFAETYFDVGSQPGGPGSRIFNVTIEGNPVLTNFDILSEVDAATALQKEFDNIAVNDGFASISFIAVTQNPKISGIEILPPDTFGGSNNNPNITITSPSNGWDVNEPFQVAFRVENWTISDEDTHVHYFVDDVMMPPYYSYDPITIEEIGLGSHTIKIELYNADHTPTGIFDEVTVNITGAITCNETPFPDSWAVHPLEENPYAVIYTLPDHDLDGDGLKDIVTGGWWYKNPGSASGDWVKSDIGGDFGNVAHVYDFDGDGDMDLLGTTGKYTNEILVWAQNDGSGNFTIFDNIPSGNTGYSEPFLAGIAGGVFDVGGPYQMAINWNGAEQTGALVQMLTPSDNPTEGTWTLVDIEGSVSSGEDIKAGDIDRDGALDLFQGINWMRNNGNGNFETFDTGITYGSTPDRAQLADFDRDGDLDAVVGQLGLGGNANTRNEFSWFETPEDPTQPWTRHVLDTNIAGSLSVFAVDFDYDGDKDIVVGEWLGSHRLIVFDNDLCGSGEFELRVIDDGALDFEHHDGAMVTDIDNDGDLDVISNGFRNDMIPRIYENTTIPPSDDRPIADAGEDQTVMPDTTITLTGLGSDPDGGEIVSYLWTIQSSPEGDTATLTGADTTELTVDNTLEGVYVFRLSVTDDEGDTGFDEVTVTVGEGAANGGNVTRINAGGPAFTFGENNWAEDQYNNGGSTIITSEPIANTENDQLYQTERYRTGGSLIYEIPVANGVHSVNLHFAEIYWGLPGDGASGGAGSRLFNIDVEGQARIENYDIFVEAGGSAAAIVESFSGINVTDQSLTITLERITDYPKISGIEIVAPVSQGAPVADAGPDQTITLPENSVVLPGSGTDADGGTVSYLWTQQSGPDGAVLSGVETAELSVSEMAPGTYVYRLTVTDDEGESGFDEVNVSVLPEEGVLAVAEAAPITGNSPLEVSFTGSNSVGEIASYLWDFKDGNTSTEADPANTFLAEGTYDVSLTVTDAGGVTDTTLISIVVVGETDPGPDPDGVMGVFLEQNPPKDGIAVIRLVNPPENLMMLGINVHDIQGRLLNSYKPEDIVVSGNSYQVPVHILKAGLYFFEIAMNQGEPVTLKALIKN